MDRKRIAVWCLTAALVIVFGWFGIEKFQNPLLWIGFLPMWTDGFLGVSKDIWLMVMGVLELLFALMLIIPVRRVRQAGALLIAAHLVVVVLQVGLNDIGVRDLGLLLSSVALFLLL